jgi:hypothetical protein
MMISDTPEYRAGWEWATEHGPILAELFTGRDVSTPELRVRLFKEATRRWPSSSDNLINDLKQVAFVAGAVKAAVQTLPMTPEALSAIMDASLEMGFMWSSEQGKAKALESLQAKPSSWWRTKMGDASPNDVVNALSVAWRHDWAKERGRRNPRSKWEILIDVTGAREIEIFAEAVRIFEEPGSPSTYTIESSEDSFQIISRPLYEGGRMLRYPGEIVG